MHVMIDIETLGTRPDATIIQIGAVFFEPTFGGKLLNNRAFNQHVLVQDGSGSIDHATLCFWLAEKSAGRMAKALRDAKPLYDVLDALDNWPTDELGTGWDTVEGVWASPSDFDLPIIRSAYGRVGRDAPWDRRVTRDARTLFSLLPGGRPEVDWTGFVHHDARDDAVGQAMQVQKAMGLLQGPD